MVGYPLKSRRLKKRLIATTLLGSGSTTYTVAAGRCMNGK
jgi:hypothetical protein